MTNAYKDQNYSKADTYKEQNFSQEGIIKVEQKRTVKGVESQDVLNSISNYQTKYQFDNFYMNETSSAKSNVILNPKVNGVKNSQKNQVSLRQSAEKRDIGLSSFNQEIRPKTSVNYDNLSFYNNTQEQPSPKRTDKSFENKSN